MKVSYDPKVDAVSIELAEGKYDKSRKISDANIVDEDEDEDGRVLAIEVLDASINILAFGPQKVNISVQFS